MNLKLVSVLSIVGLMVACGDSGSSTTSGGSDSGGNGGGGNGGEGTGATTNGPNGPNGPAGPTVGGAGGGTECDDGTDPGDLGAAVGTPEGDNCSDCLDCSLPAGGPCEDFLATFQQTAGCIPATMGDQANWYICLFGDDKASPPAVGCVQDPPLSDAEFMTCQAACDTDYPGCEDAYLNWFSCGVCGQCPIACDGVDTEGDGPNCMPVDG